jgi:hypothetical protein
MSKSPETLNPYFYAIALIKERLKWDLCLESWKSRRTLRKQRNTYNGHTAVIVCNGPSLLTTDFRLLGKVHSIGLNKINLLFDRVEWRPSCIVSVNDLVIEQNAEYFNSTEIPIYLTSRAARKIQPRKNITFLHTSYPSSLAVDCSISLNEGYTVTVVALQLAVHLGFKKIGIIGCDHNFVTKGPANKTETANGPDQSHFDPRYFSNGVKWQLPDLRSSETYYEMANERFSQLGCKIVNCTDGGKLEIFPRQSLADFLS